MDENNEATAVETDREPDGIASEGAFMLMPTRMVDAFVRRTFGANARFLLAVSVPAHADVHRFMSYTTLPDRHAVDFLRGLSDAIAFRDPLDAQDTLDVHVVAVSSHDTPTSASPSRDASGRSATR